MKILITGGAGYIGSHTCVALLNHGIEIVVVDNLKNSKIDSIHRIREITGREFPFYEIDLLDDYSLELVFKKEKIDAVIHFAGYKSVGESVGFPLEYYYNNINGTLLLCQLMRKYNVKNLVFSSSAAVYSASEGKPISEECQLGPSNPYGRTKWMMEEILQDLYVSDPEWSISLLRYFNPIGAHPSGRIGDNPSQTPANLMPYITGVASGALEELLIYGGDYPTPDGTGVRDYIHIVDLANGHLKAIERVMTKTGVDVFNLGTGRGYSVLEVVSAFEKVSGLKIPYKIVSRRPGDIAICYADTSKAREQLNWVAAKGIEEMCADAWHWQRNNQVKYEQDQDIPFIESALKNE
ncbi:UDP-glucose 4-epimerase GalE [Cohnella cholangitidis]|uniref:UDP-glucose 4-epimerase n=1 Tax=Cohnella cholangitidis TaxID=2598458 RepID=A0A7G5BXI3_9BACL|nr:UDP-glucose 4-epimerase GalE [Cohnella cholangitidis]QMV41667.1 UDP-glucose 4-epimerase GalE [Cohnella cholangitidis]